LQAHLSRREGRLGWQRVTVGVLLILAAVALFYPFYLHEPQRFFALKSEELDLSGQPLKLMQFTGAGFLTILWSLLSYDPVLSLLAVLGLLTLRPSLPKAWSVDTWIVASFVVPYVLVIGMYNETWERFVLALLPWIGILGARAVQHA
ncbi:MAG: hypothetical protein ACKO32_09920, partial [Planctomycetia bacterium]